MYCLVDDSKIKCKDCGRTPDKIGEYVSVAREYGITPVEYVKQEEGTLNPKTGLFYCTLCYIKRGMPLGTA